MLVAGRSGCCYGWVADGPCTCDTSAVVSHCCLLTHGVFVYMCRTANIYNNNSRSEQSVEIAQGGRNSTIHRTRCLSDELVVAVNASNISLSVRLATLLQQQCQTVWRFLGTLRSLFLALLVMFCCRTSIGIAYYLHEFRYSWHELKFAANKEGGREASSSSTLADPVKETRREATFPAAQTWTILAKNSSGSAPYHTDGSKMQTLHHILLPVFCLDSRRSRSPTPVLTTGAKTTGRTAAEIYTSLPSSCVYSFAETSRQRSACEAGSVHDTLSYHSFVVLPPIAFFDP